MTNMDVLGAIELLGRIKRAAKKAAVRKRLTRKAPLKKVASKSTRKARLAKLKARMKKLPTPARKTLVKKVVKKALIKRLSPAAKKTLVKKAIAKNPALKKKLATAILKKRLDMRALPSAYGRISPTTPYETPVPSIEPSANPTEDAAEAPVQTEEAETPGEVVEAEMEEGVLDDGAAEEAATEEAVEESAADIQNTMDEESQAVDDDAAPPEDTDELTEDAEEDAEDEVDDAVDQATLEGEELLTLLGVDVGALKKRRAVKAAKVRKAAKARIATAASQPTARKIAKATNGKIPANQTMKGVAIVAAAKAGNPKAKAAIKKVSAQAKKGDPKAKKTLAQLKLSNKVLEKGKRDATKTMGPKAKKVFKKPGGRFAKPVKVISKGFASYSPYQRGLAMIPGEARARYGSR